MSQGRRNQNNTPTKEDLLEDGLRVLEEIRQFEEDALDYNRAVYMERGKYSDKEISALYGKFKIFRKAVREEFIRRNPDKRPLTRSDVERRVKRRGKARRYFVTSVIAGAVTNKEMFESVKTYCKETGTELVLLASRGVSNAKSESYAKDLVEYTNHMVTEYVFNSNLKAIDCMLHPQQFNPLNGIQRIGGKKTSSIIAHPKQQMEVVPTGVSSEIHMMWSTGSITMPEYAHTRSGAISRNDHVFGGLVVEIEDDYIFHVRQVQAREDGSITDLDMTVSGKDVTKTSCVAMTLGDIHAGWVDEKARQATFEQIELLKPKRVYVGDVFDGSSISHHTAGNVEARYKLPEHVATLENELHTYCKELELWSKRFPDVKFMLVFGNHEDHLNRYLREARYAADIPQNHYTALELAKWLLDGKNPLREWALEHYPHLAENVVWLEEKDIIKEEGIIMSLHGHHGHSGSRGSARTIEKSYTKTCTGHTHSAQVLREAWIAGCMCIMNMPYVKGATKWSHSNIVVHKGGTRQMLNSFNGKWRL